MLYESTRGKVNAMSPTPESARTVSEYPLLGWTRRFHPKFSELSPGRLTEAVRKRPNKTIHSLLTLAGREITAQQASDAKAQRQMDEILDRHTSTDTLLVQIGANNGQYDDPFFDRIARLGWRALLVEPQQEHYRTNPNVQCVRTAIDERHDQLTLWRIASDRHQEFSSATASVDPTHARTEYRRWIAPIGFASPQLQHETVPAMSLADLFYETEIEPEEVTIFATDTEGLDVSIVRSLVHSGARPSVILWEHLHTSQQAKNSVDHLLADLGYDTSLSTSKDSMAFLAA